MKNTLKNIPTEKLYAEIARREKEGSLSKLDKELAEIKTKNIKGYATSDAIVQYHFNEIDDWPEFGFFFIGNSGRLIDFYYGEDEHKLSRDEWQEFIPSCFSESMENSYEYNGPNCPEDAYRYIVNSKRKLIDQKKKQEQIKTLINEATKILLECGYKRVEEFKYD